MTGVDWLLGRASGSGISGRDATAYACAQTMGAVAGAVLANAMFAVPPALATTVRDGPRLWLGEVVATAGLITLIFALARTDRGGSTAAAVGAYIGAAYWFTSSTSFSNPAVTVGRMFSDTFTGIAPASAPGFIVAEIVGAGLGLALVLALYPDAAAVTDKVVVPHDTQPMTADPAPHR